MIARVCILSGYGINADRELGLAFERAGAEVSFVHVEDLRRGTRNLDSFNILAFPGGFSFGDHLGSGKVLSHIVRKSIRGQIEALHARGGLILGICNGFQTLAKMGILPDTKGDWTQEISLIHNEGGHFIDQWVDLEVNAHNNSPWLKGIKSMHVPIRHGEGRMVLADERLGQELLRRNLCAFTYSRGAPNGSWHDVAGITDTTGRILGMMPHPECFQFEEQDPRPREGGAVPDGLALFVNAVSFVREIQ